MFCFTLFHVASSLHAYLVHSKYVPFSLHQRAPNCMTISLLCSASLKWSAGTSTTKPSWKGFLSWLFFHWYLDSLANKISKHCELLAFAFIVKYIWFKLFKVLFCACLDYKPLFLPFGYLPISRISPGWNKHHFLLGVAYS